MIRQPSHEYQRQGSITMAAPGPHRNNRLVMTAPRPRMRRLLSEEESSSSSSGSNDSDPEEIIRKNLFAPPAVIKNDVFRAEPGIMQQTYNHNHIHQPQLQRIHSGSAKSTRTPGRASFTRTPPKKRPGRGTCSKVNRTGNDQFCGLSAEITREIAYRTPVKKTPSNAKTPGLATSKRIIMNPASRDLFRAKSSVPMTDSKLMNLRISYTASMSSSDTASSSSPRESMPGMPRINNNTAMPSLLDTPTGKPKSKAKMRKMTPFAGKLSARKKLKRCLTPPRNTFGSHMKASRTSSAAAHTLSTSYDGLNAFKMTSTEHDPAPFQVELPAKKEMMVHSKICALMDGYTAIHRDFNFAMLSGINHSTLMKEVKRSTSDKPMIAGSCHREVVKKLLECSDDLVVEGFFREYTDETNDKDSERMEACILSSESLRQIIVCFRGSTANQAKPLGRSNTYFGKQDEASSILHKEQNVPILTAFRSVYFGTPLEKTVFALLDNLATRKPFFDVVMTGHSFGAAMANIASLRYASANSQMRVSCHIFGSPRIGGEEWRQLVHSVPNLRVYRVENGNDPYVMLPSGNEWLQCGHAIQICDNMAGKEVSIEIKARRFDRESPNASNNTKLLGYVQSMVIPKNLAQGSAQGKIDHEIQSYVEKLAHSGEKWFTDFCEMKGKGVSGANNERRMLA